MWGLMEVKVLSSEKEIREQKYQYRRGQMCNGELKLQSRQMQKSI